MSVRSALLDIINHTFKLGVIEEVKVTIDNDKVFVQAKDTANTVVIQGAHTENNFGVSNGVMVITDLEILQGLLNFANFKSDKANISLEEKTMGETTFIHKIVFEDDQGQHFEHRLKNPEMAASYPKVVDQKWDVNFVPAPSKVKEFAYMANLFASRALKFEVHGDDDKVLFTVGGESGGTLVMSEDVGKTLVTRVNFPTSVVLSAMKSTDGEAELSILDNKHGGLQMAIASELGTWKYIVPAQSN